MSYISESLRLDNWEPRFRVVDSLYEAADLINKPHEDYPHRVRDTYEMLDNLIGPMSSPYGDVNEESMPLLQRYLREQLPSVSSYIIKLVHACIFAEAPFRGKWREVDVIVGQHRPPQMVAVSRWMNELEVEYAKMDSFQKLVEWYKDFETIHPFQDGNGRTGGVLLTVNGWVLTGQVWAPLQ